MDAIMASTVIPTDFYLFSTCVLLAFYFFVPVSYLFVRVF